jgi:hypothetical protein
MRTISGNSSQDYLSHPKQKTPTVKLPRLSAKLALERKIFPGTNAKLPGYPPKRGEMDKLCH